MFNKLTLVSSLTILLLLSGCSSVDDIVDDATNDILNGDTTQEDIIKSEKVLIIHSVGKIACKAIGENLGKEDYKNAIALIGKNDVSCSTYDKKSDSDCKDQTFEEWQDEGENASILKNVTGTISGDSACVIAGDK